MYEAQTYEAILSRMLQKALSINGNLDTREGSLVWCGDAPAAVELQNLYIALDTVLNETFADTATRPYLILRAAERGLKPQPASPAVLQLSITPTTLHLGKKRISLRSLSLFCLGCPFRSCFLPTVKMESWRLLTELKGCKLWWLL